jgi:hypothetical protein
MMMMMMMVVVVDVVHLPLDCNTTSMAVQETARAFRDCVPVCMCMFVYVLYILMPNQDSERYAHGTSV